MKIASIPWIIAPGLGQIHQGRVGRGVLFFSLFALFLNVFLLGPLLTTHAWVRTVSGVLGILVWVLSAADYIRAAIRGE